MSEFRFANPAAFMLLLPMVWWVVRRVRPAGVRFSALRLLEGFGRSWRTRLHYLPDLVRLMAWCVLVIALATPQRGSQRETLRGAGVDIVLALDISTSMSLLDFEPQNRLEAAKSVLAEFIRAREFDRIGLVVFARNAFYQSPLTLNYPVLLRLLSQVELVSELREVPGRRLNGTAIGLGLASAGNMLRDSQASSRLIILLTDGDNNAGIDPMQAAEAVAALGIRIYTIGMSRPGLVNAPDAEGNIQVVESNLDEETLQAIADIGDGLYFRAEDTAGLQEIYQRIDALEKSDVERVVIVQWQNAVENWLLVGLALLLTERFLRRMVFQAIP